LDGRLLSITVPVEKTCSHFRIKAHTLTKSVELFWRFNYQVESCQEIQAEKNNM